MWYAAMFRTNILLLCARTNAKITHDERYTAAVTGLMMGFPRILRTKGGTLDKGFAFEMQ